MLKAMRTLNIVLMICSISARKFPCRRKFTAVRKHSRCAYSLSFSSPEPGLKTWIFHPVCVYPFSLLRIFFERPYIIIIFSSRHRVQFRFPFLPAGICLTMAHLIENCRFSFFRFQMCLDNIVSCLYVLFFAWGF